MAQKKPLCLYEGYVKQLQPGDTLIGAYNATEAGWVVNASAWLVATPGTAKLIGRVVTGSITPVTGGGIKLQNNADMTVLKTSNANGVFVALGSAAEPVYNLHMQEKGSGGVFQSYTNDTTGHTSGDGFKIGLKSTEAVELRNQENTAMTFLTNDLQRMAITAAGIASVNTVRANTIHGLAAASLDTTLVVGGHMTGPSAKITSLDSTTATIGTLGGTTFNVTTDNITNANIGTLKVSGTASVDSDVDIGASLVVRGNASVDGNLVVGGTGAFGNSVTITADVQVAAGQKFYMDGGSDTYWTASNDVITGHVNSASIVHLRSTVAHFTTSASVDTNLNVGGNVDVSGDLTVTGSMRVSASTLYLGNNQLGNEMSDVQQLIGDVIINNATAEPMAISGAMTVESGVVVATGGIELQGESNFSVTAGGKYVFDGAAGNEYLYQSAAGRVDLMISGTRWLACKSTGFVFGNGSATPYARMHIAENAEIASFCMTNDTTGHTAADGFRLSVGDGVGCYIKAMEYPLGFTAMGTHVATWANTGLTLADGDSLKTDRILARDSGGLYLYNDGNSDGLFVSDAGTAQSSGAFVGRATASIDGTLNVGGVTTHTAGVIARSTASIDGNILWGGTMNTVTTAEFSQLANIGAVTISAGQWGYLGGMDQDVITTSNVTFNRVDVTASLVAEDVIVGGTAKARLTNCTLNASGVITDYVGDDLMLNTANDTSPDQQIIAEKIWNAVYNDVVDWQDLKEGAEVRYGKVYVDSYDGAHLPTGRCQKSVIGICSDTFGFAVGRIQGRDQIPVSVAGWALAFVDKQYESGEPLTNTSSGCLTSMNASEKSTFPERLVAIYKRPEHEEVWQGKVRVDGRHWVKVK